MCCGKTSESSRNVSNLFTVSIELAKQFPVRAAELTAVYLLLDWISMWCCLKETLSEGICCHGEMHFRILFYLSVQKIFF